MLISAALKIGVQAHKDGRLQEADRYYTAILKAEPNHADANHNMGVLAMSVGNVPQALSLFERAIQSNYKIEQFWLSFIDALFRLDRIDEIEKKIEEVANSVPNRNDFLPLTNKLRSIVSHKMEMQVQNNPTSNIAGKVGLVRNKIGRNSTTLNRRSLKKNPPSKKVKSLMNLYKKGHLTDALSIGQVLIREYPKSIVLQQVCGAIKAQLGQYNDAISHFKNILDLDPGNAEAFFNLASIMEGLGESEKAFDHYKKALSINPTFFPAIMNFAGLLKINDDLDQAIVYYKKAAKLQPHNSNCHYNLGNTYHAKKEFSLAVECFERSLQLNINFYEAHNNKGNALRSLGKIPEAIKCYESAVKINGNDVSALYNLAQAHKGNGDYSVAITTLNRILSINPKDAKALNQKALILSLQGQDTEALSFYKKALKELPHDSEILFNIGMAHKNTNNNDDAIKSFEAAIAANQDCHKAHFFLAAVRNEKPSRPPTAHVVELFDDFSMNFDKSLVCDLNYRVPELLTNIINDNIPNGKSFEAVVDLGCGTGLFGEKFAPYCKSILGVDVSENMLEQARKKNIYTKLVLSELHEFLVRNTLNFELVVTTDVFIYVGDLTEFFNSVMTSMGVGTLLAFSTEHLIGEGYRLESSGRYSHSEQYIRELCSEYNAKVIHFSTCDLRKSREDTITGGLYLLEFLG